MKAYIFDMDGVIWDGDKPIPHAAEKVNEIIASGKPYVFMTNNAMRSRDTYVKRLEKFGIKTDKGHIINSSYAAGLYIKNKNGPSKVYAVGNDELRSELEDVGHTLVDEGADFVVNGLDLTVDYEKLDKGYQNVKDGASLLACAPDLTYLEGGKKRIGSGSFARMLELVSGKELTIVGKPNKEIMEAALDVLGVGAEDCITVGDKLNTDIKAGKRIGMKTALVLTGETSREDVKKSEIEPDYILEDLGGLP
jgi:HAD superfamily hydrolase (TIGR01450 family)